MITIKRDTEDKTKRIVLSIGKNKYHLSNKEAKKLKTDINRFNLEKK